MTDWVKGAYRAPKGSYHPIQVAGCFSIGPHRTYSPEMVIDDHINDHFMTIENVVFDDIACGLYWIYMT